MNKLTYLSILLICTACSVGPDYNKPTFELPATWQTKSDNNHVSPDSTAFQHYWKQFKDPVLNKLIRKAFKNNLSIEESTYRLEEALAFRGLQLAEFFPDIDLTSDFRRRRRSQAIASAISRLHNDYYSLGGLVNWEIDLFGRLRRLNESANASLEAQVAEYRGVILSINAQIASSYARYRILEEQIELTKENIERQEESLSITRERFQAGIAPELDFRQAESNLSQTAAVLPSLVINLTREKNALASLLGTYPEKIDKLLNKNTAKITLPQLTKLKLPFDIIKQRPDIWQAERNLAAQHALIGAAEAELYPMLTLPGNFSFEALNRFEDSTRSNSLAYSFGPSLQLNFLDFGRVRSAIKIEDQRTKQLLARYKQQVITAVQEVENAMINLNQENKRSEFLSKSVIASRQASELVRSLYLSGLTDFQNVLDSERSLFEQEILLAENKGNQFIAFIDLYRSLGGGWQTAQQKEPDKTNSDKTN